MKREKSFPTIIGIFLLGISLFGGVYLTTKTQTTQTKASGDCQPDNLQITNLTHQSAAVSFITSGACLSDLLVDNRTIIDTRFQVTSTAPSPTKIHYFQVFGLLANTDYTFSLINSGKTYSNSTYKFKTASQPKGNIPQSNLAWGKVLTSDQQPATNVILYLNIPGAYPLSSYVTSQGNWNISLAYSFNDAKNSWFQPPDSGIDEDITVISDTNSPTQVTNSTNRNNPVPDITLGKNNLPDLPNNNQESAKIPANSQTSSPNVKRLDISNPKDGETISTNQPQFFGSAPPNSQVVITVHSDQSYDGQVISTATGEWSWSLPGNLSSGEHTITVKTLNPSTGIWDTITRKFYVIASDGNNLAFSSTPSATTNPSPTKAITITPTSLPTNIPTSKPTAIPTAVRVNHPSTSSGIPVTGDSRPTILIVIFATISFILARRFL